MVFSATLSYVLAATVGASGLVAVSKVPSWRYLPFAAIPLLFAVQQIIEGLIWQRLSDGGLSSDIPSLAASFVFIAEAVWPIFIPLAIVLIEPERWRQYVLIVLGIVGLFVFLFFTSLVSVGTYNASIEGDCIRYSGCIELSQQFSMYPFAPGHKWTFSDLEWTAVPFTLVTVGALLVSSDRYVRWFGYLAGFGIVAAVAIQPSAFISVWCFFAAIASLAVVYAVLKARPRPNESI